MPAQIFLEVFFGWKGLNYSVWEDEFDFPLSSIKRFTAMDCILEVRSAILCSEASRLGFSGFGDADGSYDRLPVGNGIFSGQS